MNQLPLRQKKTLKQTEVIEIESNLMLKIAEDYVCSKHRFVKTFSVIATDDGFRYRVGIKDLQMSAPSFIHVYNGNSRKNATINYNKITEETLHTFITEVKQEVYVDK